MNVLIACEESQRVCTEFREKGHNAFSCDVLPCSGGHPEWHIMQDVLPLLNGRCSFVTIDGTRHEIPERWDLIIAHPPCTYLTNAGTRHFSLVASPADKVVARWEERAKAAVFFMYFVLADCPRICVENPVGFMSTAFRKPDQVIHPYMFAESVEDKENYVTKRTCLWLKGLEPLRGNDLPKPKLETYWSTYANKPKSKTFIEYSARSACERSKTFPGIAKAMVDAWG